MGQGRTVEFGVNLNNREPLIAPGYGMPELLDLSQHVEELGFTSVWVGDSLFSKPRFEPISLLAAISQRTKDVKLGTACLVSSPRNPLYLALEWATLDIISGGRTIFGCCAGNPEKGVRREFEAVGLDFDRRFDIFEEGLESCASSGSTAPSPTTARPTTTTRSASSRAPRWARSCRSSDPRRSGSCPTRGS